MNKQEIQEEETNKMPTGFEMLDAALNGGFSKSDLVILSARPSMGKTSLSI